MFIRLNRQKSVIVRWLQSVTTKKAYNQSLVGINCTNDETMATDGKRIHAIEGNAIGLELGELIKTKLVEFHPTVRVGENIVEVDDVQGKYPSFGNVYPSSKKPVLTIAINPEYLIDCLKGMPKRVPVVFQFYGKDQPFEVFGRVGKTIVDSVPAYALIMPMDVEHQREKRWKPYTDEPTPPTGTQPDQYPTQEEESEFIDGVVGDAYSDTDKEQPESE